MTRWPASGCCTAPGRSISRGEPATARSALLVLWASEHLDMLWRLEERLGRGQDLGSPAASVPADAPAAAPAE